MTRLLYFIALLCCILFIWLVPLYYPLTAQMFQDFPYIHLFWKLIPIELPFLWGIYAGLSVLNNVRKVKDYPKAQPELWDDIAEAKDALKKSGFVWN